VGTASPNFKPMSFAIVPKMTAAMSRGCAVYGGGANVWQAFNRNATQNGTFGADAWVTIAFPKTRTIRGWALQFLSQTANFNLQIQGLHNGTWTDIVPWTPQKSPVNNGRFEATTPMECTAVKIRTSHASAVRSCQFFDSEPLVPVTMTSNTLPSAAGIVLSSSETGNANLFNCFRNQSAAYQLGTRTWYANNGSNKGKPSYKDQSRFEIRFTEPKTVCGFWVGGLAIYTAANCYANCLLIEGRASVDDFWQRIDEVDFNPALQETQYCDFPVDHTVGQLRVTVQDVTSGTSSPLYLSPMQIWGE
jgi:hypothetical protein